MPITGYVSHCLQIALPGTGPYVGPGDVVPGATAWWGLRAYTNAKIGTPAIRLRENGANTESDFSTVAGGGLPIAAINAFRTSNGGTLLNVTKLYDQSGNGNDLVQTNMAVQPFFALATLGSFPTIDFESAGTFFLNKATGASILGSQPFTVSAVMFNNGAGGNAAIGAFFDPANGPTFIASLGIDNTIGKIYIYCGTVFEVTCSATTWHAVQGMYNTTTSQLQVDSTLTTGGSVSTNTGGNGSLAMGDADNAGSFPFNGFVMETGWWTGDKSSTFNTLNSNQHAFYGF